MGHEAALPAVPRSCAPVCRDLKPTRIRRYLPHALLCAKAHKDLQLGDRIEATRGPGAAAASGAPLAVIPDINSDFNPPNRQPNTVVRYIDSQKTDGDGYSAS
jgi:hypothetical protein